jgi:threonine/homoserine/homoserine lactone efflux protein
MQIETIIAFLSASALLTIMPGPDIIYVMLQSISNGKKYGIVTALGLVSGIIIHTSLIAFGISELINKNESLLYLIKILGALYLFYLAYQSYKHPSKVELNSDLPKTSLPVMFRQGFIMNVLNPKVTIFFLAFFPAFIDSSLPNTKIQIFTLGLLFMFQALVIFTLVSFLADKMASLLRNNNSFEKSLRLIQIIIFIGIGIFILL